MKSYKTTLRTEQKRICCACHEFFGPMVYNLCILKRTDRYPLIVAFSAWLNKSKPLKQYQQ